MAVARFVRFAVEPEDAPELLRRRERLIEAVRRDYPGLSEARLVRMTERNWLDMWRWESAEAMEAAVAGAPGLGETGAAFALAKDVSAETAVIVDER